MKRYLGILLSVVAALCMLTGCGKKYLEEGVELLEAGDYEEAANRFKEAAESNQDPGEAYRGIGIARWELGQYEAARNAFESALEEGAQKTASIYNFLGNCEMELKNYKAALNYYNLGIASEDCSQEMMQEMKFNEIVAYEQCGEWENARAKLKEYTEEYPEDERAAKEAEFLETQ